MNIKNLIKEVHIYYLWEFLLSPDCEDSLPLPLAWETPNGDFEKNDLLEKIYNHFAYENKDGSLSKYTLYPPLIYNYIQDEYIYP